MIREEALSRLYRDRVKGARTTLTIEPYEDLDGDRADYYTVRCSYEGVSVTFGKDTDMPLAEVVDRACKWLAGVRA